MVADIRRELATTCADDLALVVPAEAWVRRILHPSIYHHTMRVLHLASHLAASQPSGDGDALAIAALFHDAGTADENDGDQRFEVEGADAAVRFLIEQGWSTDRARPVWEAIALHTSPGISERFSPIARLLRSAVLIDLRLEEHTVAPSPRLEEELVQHPRDDVDHVLPSEVLRQALRPGREAKAPPSSWPGALLAEHRARAGDGG